MLLAFLIRKFTYFVVSSNGHYWNRIRMRILLNTRSKTLIHDENAFMKNYFILFCTFFGGLECGGHSFAYVAHFVFLRDVWIRTRRAGVATS
jgi:hypothetical protein